MTTKTHIRIGSRGSKLALTQSRSVLAEITRLHPDLKLELVEITTAGDKNRTLSLQRFGGEGIFVKELEEALLRGWIDMAVHSLKDMPTILPDGLRLAAVAGRVDPRDVLVSRSGSLSELPQGAKIGTGSPRRVVQLLAARPDLEIFGLRGNIDTRLRRVSAPDGLDGIVMAAAALIRLGMEDRITEYLPERTFVPAVGQGALGIEIRDDDETVAEILAPVNDPTAWHEVIAERSFLKALGGGCTAPIAALGRLNGAPLTLYGMASNRVGDSILRAEVSGSAADPKGVGNLLAGKMFGLGVRELLSQEGK